MFAVIGGNDMENNVENKTENGMENMAENIEAAAEAAAENTTETAVEKKDWMPEFFKNIDAALLKKAGFALLAGVIAACAAALLTEEEPITIRDAKEVTRADIVYKDVEAPAAANPDGVVSAEEWAAVYPEIAETMMRNDENSYAVSYLEEDPYLVNIYEGYGFAKDYMSARGHNFCLEDVAATQRPHATANCLTCKSPNFTKLVNDQGVGVYSMDFNEVHAQMAESTSCYNCHANEAGHQGELVVTHSYIVEALGENMAEIDPVILSCGQCHIEYYFKPETKEAYVAYNSKETMTPEAILAAFNEMGFSDWTQESTGAHMLKAQHPEMETVLYGKHAAMGMNCADCHMPLEVSQTDGSVYHSHKWVSPLENETLLAYCATCHGDVDMVTFVHNLQDRITARETEVGNKLSDFKDALAEANQSGNWSEEDLDVVRDLYRSAQWYFDFCYVENSEGAHNSSLSNECLDTSESIIQQGMEMLTNT